jgi:hypothetical protein
MSELDPTKIKLLSITAEMPAGSSGRDEDYAKVVFKIEKYGPEYPVYIYRPNISDENIIRVARHYFYMQMQRLADSTVSWKLSDDEYKRISSPPLQKTPPNTGPAIPR